MKWCPWGGWGSLPSTSGISILSLLTPYPLLLGCRYLRLLAFSLDFSIVRRELILAYYWVLPIFFISRSLSSKYVALGVIQFFLQRWYSFMDFGFWWKRVLMLRGSHHLLPVISANFVTVFSFIFFLVYSLYEESNKSETKLGYFDRSWGLHIARVETSDTGVGFLSFLD